MVKVTVCINKKTGKIEIDVSNMKGKGCVDLANFIIRPFSSDPEITKKRAYFKHDTHDLERVRTR